MADLLAALLLATLTSSAALIVIGTLRLPLRYAFGARAAYWLWLLAPLSIVGLIIPRPDLATTETTQTFSAATNHVWHALSAASIVSNHVRLGLEATVGLFVWFTGTVAALCINVLRQYRFVHALAPLSKGPDGTLRSGAIVMPLVVGAWSPRVIIPLDFEQRYSESRRQLMIAHEAMHVARWDTRIAAVGVGWACVLWFNPLVYWALSRLRLDQELACDAEILGNFKGSGRDYAAALLDAQMADQISIRPPIACHWQSAHPLTRRVTMLTRKLPGNTRARIGVVVAIAVSALASAVAWAAQPKDATAGSPVTLNMIWFADHDPRFPGRIVRLSVNNRLVQDGATFTSMSTHRNYGVECIPSTVAHEPKHRRPLIELRCKLRVDGRIFADREVTVREDQLMALDTRDPKTGTRLYVVLSASPSYTLGQKAHMQ